MLLRMLAMHCCFTNSFLVVCSCVNSPTAVIHVLISYACRLGWVGDIQLARLKDGESIDAIKASLAVADDVEQPAAEERQREEEPDSEGSPTQEESDQTTQVVGGVSDDPFAGDIASISLSTDQATESDTEDPLATMLAQPAPEPGPKVPPQSQDTQEMQGGTGSTTTQGSRVVVSTTEIDPLGIGSQYPAFDYAPVSQPKTILQQWVIS
eukprot:m.242976 g.242976  ORF g.242976 m.242976 type:complete len:210 (+) comp15338_c1_seq3:1776-2405(+)